MFCSVSFFLPLPSSLIFLYIPYTKTPTYLDSTTHDTFPFLSLPLRLRSHYNKSEKNITMSSTSPDNVRKALDIARDSTDGNIEPKINEILETAIADLKRKLEAQPDTYVLSRDEFALFNFYRRTKFNDSQKLAQKATERFWNNYRQSTKT